MATKLLKSNLLSIGVISAISAAGLLFGGLEAKAQTTDSNQMNQMDQNQLNQSPTQPNQNNAAPASPSTVQPSQNNSPSTITLPSTPSTDGTSPLSQYSPNQAPILRVGSQGQAVRDVQALLSQQGLYRNAPDGVYGSQTQAAVRQFQQSQNLPVDGIVGPQTWGAMLNSGNVNNSGQAQ
ncbi:peptidoglycan-binding protein [Phormidium sp. LEGE 05292]|uniref:peptidoglycan-binding domain-containing protein n=1 Tax=[Phormidium] sp. LEGE 05292 TaxID=767427 RepID=UPI00187F5498|nr:peptidoglycan-binding domain-containing protein [Phormidium sp. LEGE 05292]MBE9226772.1 peptidoglycan-binding protein [Phormidium sp. LEGE 05292]